MPRSSRKSPAVPLESALFVAVSALVLSGDVDRVEETLRVRFNLPKSEAKKIVKLAKNKITLASEIDKKEELGRRILQLDEIYQKSLDASDAKTALLTLKEKSKLLDLYSYFSRESLEAASESVETELARAHLENLNLTRKGAPIEELARQIALYVVDKIESARSGDLPSS